VSVPANAPQGTPLSAAAALDASGGVVAQVARDVGVARTTLSSRMDALGLRDPKR
jgi:hypothetical protein